MLLNRRRRKGLQVLLFFEKYGRWADVTKATMRIQHKPGDTMEVNWARATLDIHDPVIGKVSKACLFVEVLLCSCFTYAKPATT